MSAVPLTSIRSRLGMGKEIQVSTSSVVDLKAELFRQQQEFKRERQASGPASRRPTVKKVRVVNGITPVLTRVVGTSRMFGRGRIKASKAAFSATPSASAFRGATRRPSCSARRASTTSLRAAAPS